MSFTPIAILLSSARQWTELQASSWSDSHPHRFPRARGTFSAAIRHARNRRQHTLISFIWSPGNPLPAGTGGSENYTVGQVRELNRQGVPAQVVTIGLGVDDGRNEFTDVPFRSLRTLGEVGGLRGTIGFVNGTARVAASQQQPRAPARPRVLGELLGRRRLADHGLAPFRRPVLRRATPAGQESRHD